jgi:catecholate siderophore receptor
VGSKWDLLQQKLSLSAAAYRTDVRNEIEVDPTNSALYYQSGKKRVQGLELGVTGELMRNWLISAGYTRMASEVVSGKVVTNSGENRLSYTPKQAVYGMDFLHPASRPADRRRRPLRRQAVARY